MKKGLMIALTVFCVGLATGCSGQSSDRNGESAESPVADTAEGQGLSQETEESAGQPDASQEPDASKEQDVSGDTDTSKEAAASEEPDTTEAVAAGETDRNKTEKKDKSSKTSSDQKTGSDAGNKKDTSSSQGEKQTGETSVTIERAKKIALKKAGLQEQDGSWKKEKVDWEDGRKVYELEFISGKTEYDFEIDAENGKILEYDKDFD